VKIKLSAGKRRFAVYKRQHSPLLERLQKSIMAYQMDKWRGQVVRRSL
jgi:hypothetical protein